jgi:beta-glucanase (GH16 family)
MHVYYLNEQGIKESVGQNWLGPDFSANWHTFAVDWRSDRVVWLVDGVEVWRFDDQRYIPAKNLYILLDLAVGGDYPGPPTPNTTFPSYFDVDYVRVWRAAK